LELINKEITLNYNNFHLDEVLAAILPKDVVIPSAFEQIGHIAHLNLHNNQLPFKNAIGQAILDKNPTIKTVVNKVGSIENVFRTFEMELLAGEDNFQTEVNESKCLFKFNFKEVYWNSRLQAEHGILVDTFKKTDIVCDMMAGIGPFAIPAARYKNCQVFANDLNPASYKYLVENIKVNKVQGKVFAYNLDAREFVQKIMEKAPINDENLPFTQVIMNLPASSIEFLDVFRGIFFGRKYSSLPKIHCYAFSEAEDKKKDIIQRVENVLQSNEIANNCEVFDIRDISKSKEMMRISFTLPSEVAYSVNKKRKAEEI